MRLLNTKTKRLDFFTKKPEYGYAILSHVWGDEEITFQDIEILAAADEEENHDHARKMSERVRLKAGWQKITESCKEARKLKFEWIWIDTCCIDKTSSAELSEAINSMFEWYEGAVVCIAYLNDVTATNPQYEYQDYIQTWVMPKSEVDDDDDDECINVKKAEAEAEAKKTYHFMSHAEWILKNQCWDQIRDQSFNNSRASDEFEIEFMESRWFTRGWTLQELVAPRVLLFYSTHWQPLGTRNFLKSIVHDISSVPENVLETRPGERKELLQGICVAEKMAWAARRKTTRPEDVAYSLLGIFDINMPLIYGEGKVKAFRRLQEEILRSTDDDSIFAWRYSVTRAQQQKFSGLLADGPDAFERYENYRAESPQFMSRSSNLATGTSARGLHVELALRRCRCDWSESIFVGVLGCDMRESKMKKVLTPAILLQRTSWYNETEFVRVLPDTLAMLERGRIVYPKRFAEKFQFHGASEVVACQIWIPHQLPPPQSPYGVICRYRDIFPDRYSSRRDAGHNLPAFNVGLGEKSRLWKSDWDAYVLDFGDARTPGLGNLTRVVSFGSLKFSIRNEIKKNQSRRRSKTSNASCYLAMGLDPLPENTCDTPALYMKPWCAFAIKEVTEGTFDREEWMKSDTPTTLSWILNPDRRPKVYAHSDKDGVEWFTSARLELQTHFSRLYYTVVLDSTTTTPPVGSRVFDMDLKTAFVSSTGLVYQDIKN